ncbi:MAG: dienelactone hydrolase family protein [Bacteroidia bacterium]|nr:dienelactone hydrolase family protein [Bacteroidia bacterium]MCF8426935.1 dienelactone hydrolase family protein [Bacteroidia bacterium]MCF8446823.1 dienelactone hydrolase family protein [Bacteroidia bacterium]
MFRIILLSFLLLVQTNLFSATFQEVEAKSRAVIDLFVSKQFTILESQIDPLYKSTYTAISLGRDWEELTGTYGQYVNAKPVNFEVNEYYQFIAYKMNFEYLPYIFNISFNAEGKIIYISFMPAHKMYVAPNYCDISKISERKINVVNGFYEMPGLLSRPNSDAKAPLVIILMEAGPTDKDGSYEENKPYKDLAWGLSTNGYAVFRYEKRANNYGIYMMKDKAAYETFTPREDLLLDLYKIIDTLKTLPDIDPSRIYILGHGQGGMLAPLVAKEREDVKGIVMMGANAKPTQIMMIEQYKYLTEVTPNKRDEYDEQTAKALVSLDKKLNPLTEHSKMPYNVQATYWIWLNNYKHLEITKKLKKPVLILHGDRDYQVNMSNLELWKKTLVKNKDVTIKNYPKLNHLFYSGEVKSTYSEYYMIGNIPDYVITDITNWLKEN